MLPITEYPKVVQDAIKLLGPALANEPERVHLAEYLTGLLIAENKTVSGIAGAFLNGPDQSSLNRFLTRAPWNPRDLNERRLAWLQQDSQARFSDHGTISIDNVLVSHAGELIEDVGCFWDHNDRRYLIAHDYLIAGYAAAGGKSYPLEFRRFVKADACKARGLEPRSHHDLFRELVAWCVEHKVQGTFAFDSWFSCPANLNFIHAHQRAYVGELKHNRHVFFQGQELRAGDLAARIPPADRQALGPQADAQWFFTVTVRLPKVDHGARILVLWRKREDAEPVKILLTNQVRWDKHRTRRAYAARWRGSECFHRDGKQHLGMGDCQLRSGQGQTRHLYLLFVAHSLLVRRMGCSPRGWIPTALMTIGQGCRAVLRDAIARTIEWVAEKVRSDRWSTRKVQAVLGLA